MHRVSPQMNTSQRRESEVGKKSKRRRNALFLYLLKGRRDQLVIPGIPPSKPRNTTTDARRMRSPRDLSTRWKETTVPSDLAELKSKFMLAGNDSPCTPGLRSVYWKIFLLFESTDQSTWSRTLSDSRSAYSSLRSHFLKFIEHPEELSSSLDPLDDDQSSPWNSLRQDEEIRAEILQDVERCMPEEPFFRKPDTQQKLLDILFIFTKLNQDVGYRQGMHELLAPFLMVLETDAVDKRSSTRGDPLMLDMLELRFIEHDAFTLFSILMRSAKSSYGLEEPEKKPQSPSRTGAMSPRQDSPIVERSKQIHEVYLKQLDAELAQHLIDVEVLPQIFLIRWIRLLFSREFPLEELLILWDKLFAEDASLELVDMICVAMLLRIRWQLIEADYSLALILLLRYPAPTHPHQFVDDAIYLRENFHSQGAFSLIVKHGGQSPSSNLLRPSTPHTLGSFAQTHQRFAKRRSPLPSPARFIQQQGGVEAILQGAARGMYHRGEKMGINQRVRDAVGEVKKNMQNLQTPPSHSRRSLVTSRWSLDEGRSVPSSQTLQATMEKRNQDLARMLDEAMTGLRSVTQESTASREAIIESIDIAVAKMQFVKVYLEDASMALPEQPQQADRPETLIVERVRGSVLRSPQPFQPPFSSRDNQIVEADTLVSVAKPEANGKARESPSPANETTAKATRPVSVPTRSNLAQSSFAFMLEPDQISSTTSSPAKEVSPFSAPSKQRAGREKAAFLFGEVSETTEVISAKRRNTQESFDLGTMRGANESG